MMVCNGADGTYVLEAIKKAGQIGQIRCLGGLKGMSVSVGITSPEDHVGIIAKDLVLSGRRKENLDWLNGLVNRSPQMDSVNLL
jgi:hypothetical protein